MAVNSTYSRKVKDLPVFIFSSILITLFLGFIDEGYYNFNWMNNIGNWIALSVYAIFILSAQFITSRIILSKYTGSGKIPLSIFIGTILGISFVVLVIF